MEMLIIKSRFSFFLLWSWKSTNREILVIVPEFIVRTSQCCQSVSPTFVPPLETFEKPLPSNSSSIITAACRPVRHPWGGHGQTLLPQVHGRVHTQVLPAPSHRRSLLWDRFPPHAVHGASRVSAKATSQPVCPQVRSVVLLLLVTLCRSLNFPAFSFRLYGFKIHPMAYQLQLQAASTFKSPVKTIR